jgi:NitT/TauT family transport system substrate-binding protein
MKRSHRFLALGAAVALLLAACSSAGSSVALKAVKLQLQWLDQSQFAGYYAAAAQGYYRDEGLEVTFLPGGGDVVPQQVGSAANGPEFTIAWVPKVLQAREADSDLVQIAQMFQRAGTRSVSCKSAGITGPDDWKGKKIGAWPYGNELEVIGAATLAGLTAGTDYTRVDQTFDMNMLIKARDGCAASATDCVDVAEAMIYNEWAQLLEATNADTGELYQPSDFTVYDYNEHGQAMLQDALWARAAWLAEDGNADVATKFLRASFKGWIYCRDNPDACVQYALDHGSQWGKGHLAWMMNEVNNLYWPVPGGIGALDPDAWAQTIETALAGKILTAEPADGAFRTDLAAAAREGIDPADATGNDYVKPVVEITPNGE